MNESPLLYNVENFVGTLTINRPEKRNALSAELISLLLARLDEAEADATVRVVLITGAGEKAFCAGADLGGGVGGKGTAEYATLLKRLAAFSKPLVAAVKGYCLAGGMGVMLACDLVLARDDAQFGTPEVNVGLWPMMIGALIYRNMLPKRAAEMVMLGQRFSADAAYRMGFVTRVLETAVFDQTIHDITTQLAGKSPIGMKIGKEAFYAMAGMPFETAVDYLSDKLVEVAATEDAAEGVAAFMEKRKPEFKGR
ncbi:MAG: enoyl-CoA hydratase/isomerase family protein [Anaerolineales bacterium]|nr:enoyl-CoA hydratase/isomerase family protein [Anaerolineales bacterium]